MEITNLQDAEYMDYLLSPLRHYLFGEYFDITCCTEDDGVFMEINNKEQYDEQNTEVKTKLA